MKYIDSEKLIAEIERRIDLICTTEGVVQRDKLQEYEALRDIGDFITSLQQEQPEVDLEKEANECWDYVFSAIGWDENSLITMNHKEFLDFARHFYELGLKARKV